MGPGPAPPTARLLWDRWYGGKTFHQEPLYPYLLGASYALFGAGVLPMLLLQLAVGVVGNVLVHRVALRAFGDLVAAGAALLAVLSGPIVYYELLLLRDSLVATFGLALVLLVWRALERPSPARLAALGAAFGVGLLLKSSLAALLLVVLAGLGWTYRRTLRSVASGSAILLGALLLVLAPAIARNVAVGVAPLSLSSVGAITFACANAEDYGRAGGLFGEFFVSERHAPAVMAESDGRLVPAIRATLSTHESPLGYLRQLAGKLGAILWWYEIPNNTNFFYFALHAPVLRWLPVGFGLVGPLAVVGLALSARDFRRLWPLQGLVATTLLVMLAFGVFSRLRLPLVLPLLPFAAFAGVRLVGFVVSRRIAAAAATGAAALGLAVFAARPLPEGHPLIRPSDFSAAYVAFYGPAVDAAYERGEPCEAARIYEDSLRHEPEEVSRFRAETPPARPHEVQLALVYRKVHARQAAALEACLRTTVDAAARVSLEDRLEARRRRVASLEAALSAAGVRP
jgi:4-amino-4-deoxy-L-arabinose transferase-like glycosyltransferase